MTGKTADIRIDDLHKPVLSELQQQIKAATDAQDIEISSEAILEQAKAATGLSEFGEEDFKERLALWVKAINDDKNASNATRYNMLQMYTRYAITRLRLEDLLLKHPEILDINIDRPIIVAGLPRSGTTHLLNLISADTRLRSLPWWEATEPFPDPKENPGDDGIDPRWHRASEGWNQQDALLPHLKAMHGFDPDHISEDIELQAIDFSSYLIEWLFFAPEWRDYSEQHDQSHSYAYLKKALQALTWLKGPNRWVIKCPQHMEQLPLLHKTFPDATIVISHRDPVASIQSAITMSAYAARISRNVVSYDENAQLAEYWIDRYKRLLKHCTEDRDSLPEPQVIDVYFHELMNDTDAILRKIYQTADLPLTEETLKALHAFIDANPKGKHGKVIYNLREDFKLEPETIRQQFDFYFQRFAVAVEVK